MPTNPFCAHAVYIIILKLNKKLEKELKLLIYSHAKGENLRNNPDNLLIVNT